MPRVTDDAAATLSPVRVAAACVAARHQWRVQELNPVTLVSVMMLQVLHATSCRGALRVAGMDVTPMADCKVKQRISLKVLQRLVLMLAERERQVAGRASGNDSDAQAGVPGTLCSDGGWLGRHQCPTPRPCKRPSASPPGRPLGVDSRWSICWPCSTRPVA